MHLLFFTIIHHFILGGDASMTALAAQQTSESFEQFQSGSNKRKRMVEYLTENMYINKKQKISAQQFRRGRFEYDQLGILRTKPGKECNIQSRMWLILWEK